MRVPDREDGDSSLPGLFTVTVFRRQNWWVNQWMYFWETHYKNVSHYSKHHYEHPMLQLFLGPSDSTRRTCQACPGWGVGTNPESKVTS